MDIKYAFFWNRWHRMRFVWPLIWTGIVDVGGHNLRVINYDFIGLFLGPRQSRIEPLKANPVCTFLFIHWWVWAKSLLFQARRRKRKPSIISECCHLPDHRTFLDIPTRYIYVLHVELISQFENCPERIK